MQLFDRYWASHESRKVVVGSACSGTDSPIIALRHLSSASQPKAGEITHAFSCENQKRKREWITSNFGKDLQALFGDVHELSADSAYDFVSQQHVPIPRVDLLIAGFVCKSVSTENNDRGKYVDCIQQSAGQTGDTFAGVFAYIARHRPQLVVLENVEGLVKRNKGEDPQVFQVRHIHVAPQSN